MRLMAGSTLDEDDLHQLVEQTFAVADRNKDDFIDFAEFASVRILITSFLLKSALMVFALRALLLEL